MKTHSHRRKNGFTLIELLVVIAIIAVLAGAGFAAAQAAIQKAKRTSALATCVALESAVSNFYSEYGSMPKDAVTTDTIIDTTTDKEFLNALLGYTESASTPLNMRGIKFLNVREGKKVGDKGMNGLLTTGTAQSIKADGLYDPWGGPYKVMLDGDYNESVTPAPKAGGGKPLSRRSAAWSDGAETANNKPADDVITWTK